MVAVSDLVPNASEKWTLIVIGIMTIAVPFFWFTPYVKRVLRPLKVLTIFIHELGHLIVGKCTRAQFVEWHIDPDLGGSTLLNGGDPYYYLPAGHLVSILVGAALIFCGFNQVASQVIVSIIWMFFLVFVFVRGLDKNTRAATMLLLVAFFSLCYIPEPPAGGLAARYIVVFFGLMNAWYWLWDALEDWVCHKENKSDQRLCVNICWPCTPTCYGGTWAFVSVACMGGAILGGLICND